MKKKFYKSHLFATIAILLIAVIFDFSFYALQSGMFKAEPTVETKANNTYDKTLRVIADYDYLPYSFYDSDDNISGHDVEVINLIANELEMNVEYEFVPWNLAIIDAVSGKGDVLLTCDYGDNNSGIEKLIKSAPEAKDDFSVYSKDGVNTFSELFGKRIAIMENGNVVTNIKMLNLEEQCVYYHSNEEALLAVENGEADCAIIRKTIAETIIRKNNINDISYKFDIADSYICFGITNNNQELCDKINAAIEKLTEKGELERLQNKWLTTFVHKETFKEFIDKNLWILFGFVVVLLALFVYVFVSEIKKKNETEHQKEVLDSVIGNEGAFLIDCKNDTRETLHNYASNAKGFKDNEKFSDSFLRYVDTLVAEPDREMMKEYASPEHLLELLKSKKEIVVNYRDQSEEVQRFYQMKMVKFSNDVILQSFKENDADVVNELLFNKIKDDYFAIFGVDLEAELIRAYGNDPLRLLEGEGSVSTLSSVMQKLASNFEGNTKELIEKLGDAKYVKERFAKENRAEFRVRSADKDGAWVNITCIILKRNRNNIPEICAYAFNYLDDESSKLQETQAELTDTLNKLDDEARRNELFFDSFNAGKWTYKINENDEIVEAHYSDNVHVNAHTKLMDSPMGWVDNIHPDDRDRVVSEIMAAIYDHSGKTKYDTIFRVYTENGEPVWNRSAGRVIINADGSREFYGMSTDLTEQIIEQEKHRLELANALKDAQKANAAKTEFLFNMSHDIRTPMNAILGFMELAKKQINNPDVLLDYIDKSQEASKLLLTLINSVLDMSRIESGNISLQEAPGDIRFSFESIEGTMQELAQSKNINLSFEFGNITDYYVYADYERCLRVFVNIISNGIKYSKPNGYVKVKCEQTGRRDDGYGIYKYTFEDNGIGMSEEFLEHVFEYFAREENSTIRGIQGTGIGLAVCKSFVDMMKGSIECKSEKGVGTTVIVTLPLRIQSEEERKQDIESKANEISSTDLVDKKLENKKVLLVEDNELNAEIAEEILKDKKLIVEIANDGTVAVDMIKEKGPDYYDFVLMDIQMPIMGGYEATEAIRMMYPDSKLPIIALSANAFDEDKEASIKAGMNDHIAKPINVKELFNVLSKFI